jgi:Flp pilus assembly protein TadD
MKNKRFCLKTLAVFFLFGISLTGCGSVPHVHPTPILSGTSGAELENTVEVLGSSWTKFQGRLLRIGATGSSAKNNVLIRATWETYRLGYEHFIILSEEEDITHETHTTPGQTITTTPNYTPGQYVEGVYIPGTNSFTYKYDSSSSTSSFSSSTSSSTYLPGTTYTTTNQSVVMLIFCCSEDELLDDKPAVSVSTRSSAAIHVFSPITTREAYARGLTYAHKGDYDPAIKEFTDALRLTPDYDRAYQNRGYVYLVKGDYDRAITDFNEAIRLNPKSYVAYNNRGWAYVLRSDYDQAIEDAAESLRLKPSAEAYHTRGYAYLGKGDYDLAIEDFSESIGMDSNQAHAFNDRGEAYAGKGDYDRAIEDFNQALRIDRKHPNARQNLNNARRMRNK